MPNKSASKAPDDFVEILQSLLKHLDNRFDKVDLQFGEMFTRLDRIEFLLSAQERRISILEDRVRVIATKLGLDFQPDIHEV